MTSSRAPRWPAGMDRERLSLDDLAGQARLSDIALVEDVRRAILETNGQISIIKQPSQAQQAAG